MHDMVPRIKLEEPDLDDPLTWQGGNNDDSENENSDFFELEGVSETAPAGSGLRIVDYGSLTATSTAAAKQEYPKPAYSYSCLITLSLKNSRTERSTATSLHGHTGGRQ